MIDILHAQGVRLVNFNEVESPEPQRWKAQINGQIRTVTAAQDYSAELRDPETEFWRRADGIC